MKCLAKRPGPTRYASAAALADDLDRFARDETLSVRPADAAPTVLGLDAAAAGAGVPGSAQSDCSTQSKTVNFSYRHGLVEVPRMDFAGPGRMDRRLGYLPAMARQAAPDVLDVLRLGDAGFRRPC